MKIFKQLKKRFLKKHYKSDKQARHHLVSRKNSWFVLDRFNRLDFRLLLDRGYEQSLIDRANALIRDKNIDYFVDIGGNFGLYSIYLTNHSRLKQTFTFEPVQRNYNQLSANIFVNELDHRITLFKVAASDAPGTATIHVASSDSGWSRLDLSEVKDKPERLGKFNHEETVILQPGDNLVDLSGQKIFIKADVEGHELKALQGFKNLLTNNDCYLQVEIWQESDGTPIHDYLATLGYVEDGFIDDNVFFRKKA